MKEWTTRAWLMLSLISLGFVIHFDYLILVIPLGISCFIALLETTIKFTETHKNEEEA